MKGSTLGSALTGIVLAAGTVGIATATATATVRGLGMVCGYGLGPGVMGGRAPAFAGVLGPGDARQQKIRTIQENLARKQWGPMQGMHARMQTLRHRRRSGDIDATVNAVKGLQGSQLQMPCNRPEARKQIRALLTREQRQRLSTRYRRGRAEE